MAAEALRTEVEGVRLAILGAQLLHGGADLGRTVADHRLARAALACVVGRAVDVDQQLSAVMRLPGHRSGWVPAVLTHGHADPHAFELEDRAAMSRLEVALFVEHPVVREKDLVIHGFELAVLHESRGVEDRAVIVDKTNHGSDSLRRFGHEVEVLEVVANERALQHQVFWRVAGDDQLRKADKVGALIARAADPVDDQP